MGSEKFKLVYLDVTDWSGYGGHHCYGKLISDSGKERVEVKLKLNKKACDFLNKLDNSGVGDYRVGDETKRFETLESLIGCAKRQCKINFPDYDFLILGNNCYCQPQKIIACSKEENKEIVKENNRLWKKLENYYKTMDDRSDEFWEKYQEISKKWKELGFN